MGRIEKVQPKYGQRLPESLKSEIVENPRDGNTYWQVWSVVNGTKEEYWVGRWPEGLISGECVGFIKRP